MTIEELKERIRLDSQAAEDDGEFENDEEAEGDSADAPQSIVADFHDARILLGKCQWLLFYMSDADLCKSLTKRERTAMERLATKLSNFLNEVDAQYDG